MPECFTHFHLEREKLIIINKKINNINDIGLNKWVNLKTKLIDLLFQLIHKLIIY